MAHLVESDPEMTITDAGVAELVCPDGAVLRVSHPLLTEWRGHPGGVVVWFSYFNGRLSVKYPDAICLEKMRQVAARLQARVQGDDGEFYD